MLEKMGKAETVYANGGNIYYKHITLSRDTCLDYDYIVPPETPVLADIDISEYKF